MRLLVLCVLVQLKILSLLLGEKVLDMLLGLEVMGLLLLPGIGLRGTPSLQGLTRLGVGMPQGGVRVGSL